MRCCIISSEVFRTTYNTFRFFIKKWPGRFFCSSALIKLESHSTVYSLLKNCVLRTEYQSTRTHSSWLKLHTSVKQPENYQIYHFLSNSNIYDTKCAISCRESQLAKNATPRISKVLASRKSNWVQLMRNHIFQCIKPPKCLPVLLELIGGAGFSNPSDSCSIWTKCIESART